jgi:hypothetical protein
VSARRAPRERRGRAASGHGVVATSDAEACARCERGREGAEGGEGGGSRVRGARTSRAGRGGGRRRRATWHGGPSRAEGVRMASAAPTDRDRSREYAQMGLSARRDRSRRCSREAGGVAVFGSPPARRQKRPSRFAAHGAPAFPPRGLLLRDHPRVTPIRLPCTARGALSHFERLATRAESARRPLPRELVARSRSRARS